MSWIAALDVGTTALKAALFARDGSLAHAHEVPLETLHGEAGECEQRPDEWFDGCRTIAAAWWAAGIAPHDVAVIALSGQMQDVVALDAAGVPVCDAILYSDARATAEADAVERRFGADALRECSGNALTAASLLPKLLWLRAHAPAAFARTRHVLVGAKDYVVARLTGSYGTDPTTASTTGSFDVRAGDWAHAFGDAFGLERALLPRVHPAAETIGVVSPEAQSATGFAAGTPVLCGLGDAAAASLAAGIERAGEAYLYLGTTGWLAHFARLDDALADPVPTVFTLAGLRPGEAIRIAPVLNAGSVVAWALRLLGHRDGEEAAPYLARLEEEAAGAEGRDELLFLPYLGAERCPVYDPVPNAAFLGLSARTTRGDMLRAILEGTACSLRWCGELLALDRRRDLRAVGGGTRSDAWLQAIADTFEARVSRTGEAGVSPARGAAALAAAALGWSTSPSAFLEPAGRCEPSAASETFVPDPARAAVMQRKYRAFREAVGRAREQRVTDRGETT